MVQHRQVDALRDARRGRAGVGSQTIDEALKSTKPDVKRLVGTDGDFGEQMGLTKDWAVRIVRLVGNYAEVYDRNVGLKSRLGIPARHQSALDQWRHSVRAADPLKSWASLLP